MQSVCIHKRHHLFIFLIACTCFSCATTNTTTFTSKDLKNQEVLSTLWLQSSAEYRALCYQAYNIAKIILDRELVKPSSKPLAIIVDGDETVVSNALYEGYLVHNGVQYPAKWKEWLLAGKTTAIPGAVEFMRYAASKGVEVFYLSNREMGPPYEATFVNLKKMGFPYVDEKHVIPNRQDHRSNKTVRRKKIAEDYKILIFLGDNLDDFSGDFYHKSVEKRFDVMESYKDKFGIEYIMLPNPAYGTWIQAIQKYAKGATPDEKVRLRLQMLQGWDGE